MGTQLQTIELKPGLNKNNTSYSNEGGWINGDKIRFRDGKPRKLGGWVRQDPDIFQGVAREVQSWIDLDSNKYLALATTKRVYIYYGGTYYDVTPIRVQSTTMNAVSTVLDSATITVRIVAHDVRVGDFVNISTYQPVGGLVISGEYIVTSVIDTDTFTVQANQPAFSTETNGGDVLTYILYLQSGLEYNQVARGWGASTWGTSTWGTPRSSTSLITDLRQWSLTTWGEDLIANARGGSIYLWDKSFGLSQRMVKIPNTPLLNNFTFVSYPTRHLVSLGCTSPSGIFDPLLIRWSSSEDYTDWMPSATNTAGSQRMEHGNFLMGAEPSKLDVLVFTDTAVYSMRYTGAPYIFGFDLLGQGAGLISQHAAANVDGVVFWWSDGAFYRYDGSLRTLNCTVRDAIFEPNVATGLNKEQKQMVFAGVNQEFNEIIWFYPSQGSTKCNRYVIYNYLEDLWYDGTLERSVWESASIFAKPYATSNESILYSHEQGMNDDGQPMYSYIESAMFDIGEGDQILFMDRFIPDFNQVGNLQLTITTRKYPQSSELFSKTYTITGSKGMIPIRTRGRQTSLKLESNTTDGNFIIGKPRLSMQQDGGR